MFECETSEIFWSGVWLKKAYRLGSTQSQRWLRIHSIPLQRIENTLDWSMKEMALESFVVLDAPEEVISSVACTVATGKKMGVRVR